MVDAAIGSFFRQVLLLKFQRGWLLLLLSDLQVRFLRPLEDDGGKDFFNVFVIHQVGYSVQQCKKKKMT